ncbi:MAG: hypothetical protein ACAI38_19075 [Myxococcota bacterium]|nr:hypothetical protein [Myxococcota bacterium]
MEPITGFLSDRTTFDLDGDGATSPDELSVFDTLNVERDRFLTFNDARAVKAAFGAERATAVDRLIVASDSYRTKYQAAIAQPRLRDLFSNNVLRSKATTAAQLAREFAPAGTPQFERASRQLRELGQTPATKIF